MLHLPHALLVALSLSASDLRSHYDVESYRLELRVDPSAKKIAGVCTIEARVVADKLSTVELDIGKSLVEEAVTLLGDAKAPTRLETARSGELLACQLPSPLAKDAHFKLSVRYSGSPDSLSDFDGFHWKRTEKGEPWIATSCQGTGSKFWWPCKDSFFHPEDKPARFEMLATVPKGLYAVSNGRLLERRVQTHRFFSRTFEGAWETFHWRHDYPLETYSVTLNVAPYVVVERALALPGIEAPVDFAYYVLPEAADKAAVTFAEVPKLAEVFGDAFGPYPFPASKLAFVHTPFWGMEHSTAIAYGSSFPAWIAREKERDPAAKLRDPSGYRNADYDYILVHEFAHEWWGNAVSAADWRDFWIHEGFGTYAEGVWVEKTRGRAAADAWWAKTMKMVSKKGSLDRGEGSNSDEAYSPLIYNKGACVLHTLRTHVADDETWWKLLREFNLAYRYKNATTRDFRTAVERATARDWAQFFDQWFHGEGYPVVAGKVRVVADGIEITANVAGSAASGFNVPLDLEWVEDGQPMSERIVLGPGANETKIETLTTARDVGLPTLRHMLGKYEIDVVQAEK